MAKPRHGSTTWKEAVLISSGSSLRANSSRMAAHCNNIQRESATHLALRLHGATQILVQAILSTAFAEGIVFFALFLWNGK